jgi:hypothetical protein
MLCQGASCGGISSGDKEPRPNGIPRCGPSLTLEVRSVVEVEIEGGTETAE